MYEKIMTYTYNRAEIILTSQRRCVVRDPPPAEISTVGERAISDFSCQFQVFGVSPTVSSFHKGI